jgi:hypothetical protein
MTLSQQQITDLDNKWNSFSRYEKNFLINLLEQFNVQKTVINEARWWNTVGDVLGIFDPTGVVDLINGLDYIRQGDYFYGFLSMISVLPFVGDAIAKPIMGVSKGSKLMKGMNEALRLSKMGRTAEAAKILETASKQGGLTSKLIQSSTKWGNKLKDAVNAIPGGKLTSGLRKTINDWIDLFINTATKSSQAKKIVKFKAGKVANMNPKEAAKFIETLQKTISSNTKVFRNFKPKDPGFMAKYFWPGATVGLLWRNRALTSLARRTKWYAGFLSSLGLPFMEPEELPKQMSEQELNQKFQEYVSSPEGKKNWSDEMGSATIEQPETTYDAESMMKSMSPKSSGSGDPLFDTFDEVFSF